MNGTLRAEFFDRDPAVVAAEMIGCVLHRRTVQGVTSGRIIETEAYLAEADSACHAATGRNRKNASMFGAAGIAYVYTIHSVHCLNVVTESLGRPSAVLIRAVEPLTGRSVMQRRRPKSKEQDLCRGPGRLCQAFAIDRALDGFALCSGRRLWVSEPEASGIARIGRSPRIGVTSAKDLQLRFFEHGHDLVSGPRWLNSVGDHRH